MSWAIGEVPWGRAALEGPWSLGVPVTAMSIAISPGTGDFRLLWLPPFRIDTGLPSVVPDLLSFPTRDGIAEAMVWGRPR